jgi:hypothetical protein
VRVRVGVCVCEKGTCEVHVKVCMGGGGESGHVAVRVSSGRADFTRTPVITIP